MEVVLVVLEPPDGSAVGCQPGNAQAAAETESLHAPDRRMSTMAFSVESFRGERNTHNSVTT